MEKIFYDLIEKLNQKQKHCKSAISRVRKIKNAFSKGDLKKLNDEFEKNELEHLITKFDLKNEFDKIKQTFHSYKSKIRMEFDSNFVNECKQLGLDNIAGNSMDQFRIKGIIHTKINFSKNVCDISTFAKTKRVKSVDPKYIAKEVYKEAKRIFERKFDPEKFLSQLHEAYKSIKTKSTSQVILKEIHQAIWINNQRQGFFEKSEPNKMVAYPIDEFSVDLSRLIDSKVDRLRNGLYCKLSLGRDGVNIYRSDGSFNSYKFIEFIMEGKKDE
jgi:hypothetical protein